MSDVHSVELNKILNHFLSIFFMEILLKSQIEANVKINAIGKEMNQNDLGLFSMKLKLHQNVQ